MPKGIVRRIDHLGRVTIPMEIRKANEIKTKDKLEMVVVGGKLYLCKAENLKGYTRALDPLGRWTIPKEIRDSLNFKDDQKLDISYDTDKEAICIQRNGCEWCDNTEDLIEIKGHKICRTCAGEVEETAKGA